MRFSCKYAEEINNQAITTLPRLPETSVKKLNTGNNSLARPYLYFVTCPAFLKVAFFTKVASFLSD